MLLVLPPDVDSADIILLLSLVSTAVHVTVELLVTNSSYEANPALDILLVKAEEELLFYKILVTVPAA